MPQTSLLCTVMGDPVLPVLLSASQMTYSVSAGSVLYLHGNNAKQQPPDHSVLTPLYSAQVPSVCVGSAVSGANDRGAGVQQELLVPVFLGFQPTKIQHRNTLVCRWPFHLTFDKAKSIYSCAHF